MSIDYMFPYDEVKKDENVILYGGGKVGRCFVEQLKSNLYCNIVAIADREYKAIKQISGIKVIAPDEINAYAYDKIVISVALGKAPIVEDLENLGVDSRKIICKEWLRLDATSPTAESIVIRTVFDALNINKPSYMDVGACHPHLFSNTMDFYKAGSRGINIEPNIDLKEEFEEYRPEDINIFVGIAEKKAK